MAILVIEQSDQLLPQLLPGKICGPDPFKEGAESGHLLNVGGKHGLLVGQREGNAGQSCREAFSMEGRAGMNREEPSCRSSFLGAWWTKVS
jgi:hypothetical protein